MARSHLEHAARLLRARPDELQHLSDDALDGSEAALFLDDRLEQQQSVLGGGDPGLQQQAAGEPQTHTRRGDG